MNILLRLPSGQLMPFNNVRKTTTLYEIRKEAARRTGNLLEEVKIRKRGRYIYEKKTLEEMEMRSGTILEMRYRRREKE